MHSRHDTCALYLSEPSTRLQTVFKKELGVLTKSVYTLLPLFFGGLLIEWISISSKQTKCTKPYTYVPKGNYSVLVRSVLKQVL